jgi:hypothetical protein
MIKGYYGWDPSVMLPIIMTTTGVFLIAGLCVVVYMKWTEERRIDKVTAEWFEENDSH